VLIVDSDDELLLQLLQTVRFPYPDGDFDSSVEYDCNIVAQLKADYPQQGDQIARRTLCLTRA
jgi:hypothetical protein